MLSYSIFLLLSGAGFSVIERLWPRSPQRILRRGFGIDVLYAFLNAEVVGALVAIWLTRWISPERILPLRQVLHVEWLGAQPEWLQLLALFVTKDFFQW